jgi:tetratricopeptide (TPR) repeat protein
MEEDMNTTKLLKRNGSLVKGLLPAMLLLLLAGCSGKAPIALNDTVNKVSRSETNAEVLQSWVIADSKADVLIHIDSSDDMRVFPPSYQETIKNAADHLKRKNVLVVDQIASFIEKGGTVNLGHKAGLFKRVIWVLPAKQSVGVGGVENLKKVLYERRPYSKTDLSDFVADGKYVNGTISGIPITFSNLEDLEIDPEETAIIDIDLGFFLGLKAQDPDGRMGTRVLLDFLRVLKRKQIATSQVSINLGAISGAIPYDLRFFGNVITEIMGDPSILEGALPQKYTMMLEAEDALITGNYERAVALYEHLSERCPGDAGICFSSAVAQGFNGDGESAGESIFKAYDLDTNYLRGFFQLARVLAVNGKVGAGEKILSSPGLAKLINEDELDYQMGIFFFNAGDFYSAMTYLELVGTNRPKDFALRTVMYQAYKGMENLQMMVITLEKLIKMDEGRVTRDMPWVYKELGALADGSGVYQRALEVYQIYLQHVPNDPDAAMIRKKIGDWKAAGY